MTYIVSGQVVGGAVISVGCHTLVEALDHARVFQERFVRNVSISDSEGHRIDGAHLEACLRGEKSLTSDLRVI